LNKKYPEHFRLVIPGVSTYTKHLSWKNLVKLLNFQTSSALAFTMYCLAKNPEKQEKLRAELMKVMPQENTPLTEENMKNLPFLRAVLKESLRLYPPAPSNIRQIANDLVLGGYQVPKGTEVSLGMFGLYKNTKYFERPEEFIPERFLRPESNVETCPMSLRQKHSFAFLPFGYGPRFCVGKRIAEMELETFLCRLFRKYQVEWHYPDMKLQPAIVTLPGSELRFKMTKL
jgi:cytochrome P450 family 12